MDDEGIYDVIGAIYEAASAPELRGPVIRRMKLATSSNFGKLWFGSPNYNALEFATSCDDFLAFEHSEISLSDLGDLVRACPDPSSFTEPYAVSVRLKRVPLCQVMNGHELVPIDEFRKSEWFHLLGKPFGMVHTIGAIMEPQNDRIGGLTFYRADHEPNYGRDEQRLLSIFLPHVRRSLNLYGRLQVQNGKTQVLQSSIDTLSSAIILVNDTGKVIFLNAAANRLIKRRPELAVRRGKLHAKSHADTVQLEHLTRRATGSDGQRPIGGAVAVQRADGGPPLQIIAAPVSPDNRTMLTSSVGAVALVVIHDPNEQAHIPQEMIRTMFGLTPAEAELLLALSHGQTPKQYSDEHHVTVNTARTHLKSLFAKTRTAKQSDLVRLMSGLTQSVAL